MSLVVDCKNYSAPLAQNQVVIVSKYFGPKKASGRFGLILCRKGLGSSGKREQLNRWKDHDEMIVCLSDDNLTEMVNLKKRGLDPDKVISRIYREVRMKA